jgi:hypothetical protein
VGIMKKTLLACVLVIGTFVLGACAGGYADTGAGSAANADTSWVDDQRAADQQRAADARQAEIQQQSADQQQAAFQAQAAQQAQDDNQRMWQQVYDQQAQQALQVFQ